MAVQCGGRQDCGAGRTAFVALNDKLGTDITEEQEEGIGTLHESAYEEAVAVVMLPLVTIKQLVLDHTGCMPL